MTRTKTSKKDAALEERIEKVTAKIEALTGQIMDKKAQLKLLYKEKEEKDGQKVLDAVIKSGRSYEEVLEIISKTAEEDDEE